MLQVGSLLVYHEGLIGSLTRLSFNSVGAFFSP